MTERRRPVDQYQLTDCECDQAPHGVAVAVGDVAETPRDLRRGVRLPVGAGRGHLAAGKRPAGCRSRRSTRSWPCTTSPTPSATAETRHWNSPSPQPYFEAADLAGRRLGALGRVLARERLGCRLRLLGLHAVVLGRGEPWPSRPRRGSAPRGRRCRRSGASRTRRARRPTRRGPRHRPCRRRRRAWRWPR